MTLNSSFNLALVTGASSGLGAELSYLLAQKAIPLILSGRDAQKLESIAQKLRSFTSVETIVSDLAHSREKLLELIKTRTPDLVINNAGYTIYGDCLDHPKEQNNILSVNTIAPFELTLAAAAALKDQKKGGVIMNISSAIAFFSMPMMATYTASKAFLSSFSSSLDAEMRPFNIRILASMPGQIMTPFAARAAHHPNLKVSRFSMTTEKAARLILRQIDQRKTIQVIDAKTRIAIFLSRLLPKRFVESIMQNEIKNRRHY